MVASGNGRGHRGSLDARYTKYRDELVKFAFQLVADTVVFSHFVAINAIIGAINGDDRLVSYRLDNCSVTVIDHDDAGGLKLVRIGREADTLIR